MRMLVVMVPIPPPPPLCLQAIAYSNRRIQEEWREPLGDSGVLDLVANLLDVETMRGEGARAELQIQMLRLCGNSCADTGVAFFFFVVSSL